MFKKKIARQPGVTFFKSPQPKKTAKKEKFFYLSMTLVGVLSIFFAAGPILAWQFTILPFLTNPIKNFPIPKGQVLSQKTSNYQNVEIVKEPDGFSYFSVSQAPVYGPRPSEFSLSVPKLRITKATVKVDTIVPDNHLALFPGSALPGQTGNVFITGHSVLPQFFDPQNYSTIFSNLPQLEVGDDIYATLNGKNYQYIVQYKKIVDPRNTSVLSPITPNGRNLTLMTCVPPGSSIQRLIVVASLI